MLRARTCTAVVSSSLLGILSSAFLMTSFFQDSTFVTVVRAPKRPLRFNCRPGEAGRRRNAREWKWSNAGATGECSSCDTVCPSVCLPAALSTHQSVCQSA